MKILITGYSGFLGSNLISRLKAENGNITIYEFDVNTPLCALDEYTKDCDFVYHLAAVHRPKEESEFNTVNYGLIDYLLSKLEDNGNSCPVLYTSSIQATNGSAYGDSKVAAEHRLREHALKMNSRGIIYRLTNTFGRWARPNGHSVVATFCYNIQHDLPIVVNNRDHIMNFYYVDDVIDSFVQDLYCIAPCNNEEIKMLPQELVYTVTLGELADILYYFKKCESEGCLPELNNTVQKNLFETYKSYNY